MGYLDNVGLAYFWSKVKNYIDNTAGGGGGHLSQTVNLTATGWSLSNGYYYKTVSVSGVTATNTVIVDADGADIKCTAQDAGTLTFRSSAAQAATVKVLICS